MHTLANPWKNQVLEEEGELEGVGVGGIGSQRAEQLESKARESEESSGEREEMGRKRTKAERSKREKQRKRRREERERGVKRGREAEGEVDEEAEWGEREKRREVDVAPIHTHARPQNNEHNGDNPDPGWNSLH